MVTTNDAKYRPAASLTIVTDEGAEGSTRDQRTSRSPIFGSRGLRLSRTLKPGVLGEPDGLPVVLA
ncbi:hypothetical protein [Actinokineospora xionganensis]|uniref:hypothetical protein n=1 Tax=Actinokineospora xionganensis TaxID=2684470 RepID=UPI001FE6F792|nr:hypothetical protein [Actinokineospora xionganensis]